MFDDPQVSNTTPVAPSIGSAPPAAATPQPDNPNTENRVNEAYAAYCQASSPEEKESCTEQFLKALQQYGRAIIYKAFQQPADEVVAEAAEDILLEHLPEFEGRNGAQFSTWVYLIFINRFKRELRKIIERRNTRSLFTESNEENPDLPALDVEATIITNVLLEQVEKDLTDGDRTLLRLRREGRKHAEIGEQFQITEEAARKRWFDLRKKINPQAEHNTPAQAAC